MIFTVVSWSCRIEEKSGIIEFQWEALPDLPSPVPNIEQPGVAGAFTGLINDVMVVAGGANFPDAPPWEAGSKKYQTRIYILEKKDESNYWTTSENLHLRKPMAYGLSISMSDGLLCLGGLNEDGLSSDVFKLIFNPDTREINFIDFPKLPVAVANFSGGIIDNRVYVAASNAEGEKYFWSLNLSNLEENWRSLPVWPGPAIMYAYGAVQSNGKNLCFYLMKGRYLGENGLTENNLEGFLFDPMVVGWQRIKWKDRKTQDLILSAGPALAIGSNHIFLFGGSDGKIHREIEVLNQKVETEKDSISRTIWSAKRDSLQINHPGFSRDIFAFHTITQTLVKVGEIPSPTQVTTSAFLWDNQIVIPSGEIHPGIRTSRISTISLRHQATFGILNYYILGLYLLILVVTGIYFSKNQKSTSDFFKGGQRIPGWAAGISIFGTQLSAITFMAIPAKTFATNWTYFFLLMTIIMVMPFIIRFFLPFYRRFNLTTAYQYLELRFNYLTRAIGSLMYIFLQIGRLGIILLLPSLALSVVSGINVYMCILGMGILSILYTVMGGIEAVIWTDVLQVFVLLGGALLSLVLLYFNQDPEQIFTNIEQFDKCKIFDFNLLFSEATIWVVLLGGFATNLIQYGSDQTVIQRYLTTKDEKSAANSIRIGAWMTLPSALIFFTLGTLLFTYYRQFPLLLNPILDKTDNIFPWYIMTSLPNGISGLLIAAIFAASMSSLDSSMNSVATVITTDVIERWNKSLTVINQLKMARLITTMTGLLGTSLALIMARWGISSLWDQFNLIVGLFAGGLGGIFLLGIFSKKTNAVGAVTGLVVSGVVQFLIKEYTSIHLLLYAFTGMTISICVGYIASMFGKQNSDENLKYTYSQFSTLI